MQIIKKLLKLCLCAALASPACGQHNPPKAYRNFPLIVTIQFHSLSLPFRDLTSNFSNIGIGLGTEVSHNGKQNWVQQFNVAWYRNKTVGNGLLLSTQTVWRPTISGSFYTEIKAGLGYHYSFRPVKSFKPVNGTWVAVGHKGKGFLAIPVGVSAGYNKYTAGTYYSPFISYQVLVLKGYNKSVPIVPETLLQAGARIHF